MRTDLLTDISVIICTHNPRRDYLKRVFDALDRQTLPKTNWELLLVDNASKESVAAVYDLSWHPRARHVREDNLGLTPSRLQGIREACGNLLIFVDDDNVLAPDFLEQCRALHEQHSHIAVFGAGRLVPEFEVEPSEELRPLLRLLSLRQVARPRWSNNPTDYESIPWGAGLCVNRAVSTLYMQFVSRFDLAPVLDRKGTDLFAGGDDLVSWVASSAGWGFGIFPQLQVTHLIAEKRLNRQYFLKLIHDHAFSNSVLHFRLEGTKPPRLGWTRYAHFLLHGVKNGLFSMRCQWAESCGQHLAWQFIVSNRSRLT